MRPELDFRNLRAQIEAATWVPDFSTLYRRAGRVRMRDRMAVVGALLGTLAVFAPVAIAGVFGRPAPSTLGPNPDIGEPWTVAPTQTASSDYQSTSTILAAAGTLPDGVIAAVDVCVEVPQARRCSLQVTMLRAESADRRSPYLIDALRQSPLDKLDHVELSRISPDTFMLSGEVSGGSRSNVKFRLGPGAVADVTSPVLGPDELLVLGAGDRAVQLVQYGNLFGVRQSDNAVSRLVDQPPMSHRAVASGVPVTAGWWVTGADLRTGAPAVSVSVDQGRHWLARTLDAPVGLNAPTLVTGDGQTAHAFIPYTSGIRHFRTVDGGWSWQEVPAKIELPGVLGNDGELKGRAFGGLARPDHSLLLWVQGDSEMVFLDSADGEHFGVVAGPGGRIVTVDNGFAALTAPPRLSTDARNWQLAVLSARVIPS